MGIGPIVAIPKVLAQMGLSKEDVDVYEVGDLLTAFRHPKPTIPRSTKHSRHSLRIAWRN
ncbi:hypothetical protein EDD15DRAFT_2210795 [Pisolithus albus]|nr:hypothetical protein EDD15DRAFT_2210795 [Pisolithus albus]